jgi:hypothetical protein
MRGKGSGSTASFRPASRAAQVLLDALRITELAAKYDIELQSFHRHLRGQAAVPLKVAVRIEDIEGPPARWWLAPPEEGR